VTENEYKKKKKKKKKIKFCLTEEQYLGMSATVFCGVMGYNLCQGIALCHDSKKNV